MKCSCPKCSAVLQEDLQEIPEKGKNGSCPECKGSYWIHRESFMLRCYATQGVRCCCHCGEVLGLSTFCPGCGTLYPDYCIIGTKKPTIRSFEKKKIKLNLALPKFSAQTGGKKSSKLMTAGAKGGTSDFHRQLAMVGVGVALLAVIAVVAFLYLRDRAESQFARDYVFALYGIKSGSDQCMKKIAILAGGSRLVDKDLSQLKTVKGEIDTALQKISSPPEKYNDLQSRLLVMNSTYGKLHNLCLTSGPSADVAASAGTLETQINAQAIEIKKVLPDKILEELTVKVTRYTNLQFMLQ